MESTELLKVTEIDVLFFLIPTLEATMEKGKISLDDLELPQILQSIVKRFAAKLFYRIHPCLFFDNVPVSDVFLAFCSCYLCVCFLTQISEKGCQKTGFGVYIFIYCI